MKVGVETGEIEKTEFGFFLRHGDFDELGQSFLCVCVCVLLFISIFNLFDFEFIRWLCLES